MIAISLLFWLSSSSWIWKSEFFDYCEDEECLDEIEDELLLDELGLSINACLLPFSSSELLIAISYFLFTAPPT